MYHVYMTLNKLKTIIPILNKYQTLFEFILQHTIQNIMKKAFLQKNGMARVYKFHSFYILFER